MEVVTRPVVRGSFGGDGFEPHGIGEAFVAGEPGTRVHVADDGGMVSIWVHDLDRWTLCGPLRHPLTLPPAERSVDTDSAGGVRAAALDVELGVGRYVGVLAEAASHELGWRAGSPETN